MNTEPIERIFLKDTKDHAVTVLRDDGVYRHIKVAKPGTNFANISDGAPQRVNVVSVCRTHESGDMEIRHSNCRTRSP